MDRELVKGIADACGFVGGALGGLLAGQTFGFDVFAPGYGTASMAGILLCGLGGGLGLQLARWALARTRGDKRP